MKNYLFVLISLILVSCSGPSSTISTEEAALVGRWDVPLYEYCLADTVNISNTQTDFTVCYVELTDIEETAGAGQYRCVAGLNCNPHNLYWHLHTPTTLDIEGVSYLIDYQSTDSLVLRNQLSPNIKQMYYLRRS